MTPCFLHIPLHLRVRGQCEIRLGCQSHRSQIDKLEGTACHGLQTFIMELVRSSISQVSFRISLRVVPGSFILLRQERRLWNNIVFWKTTGQRTVSGTGKGALTAGVWTEVPSESPAPQTCSTTGVTGGVKPSAAGLAGPAHHRKALPRGWASPPRADCRPWCSLWGHREEPGRFYALVVGEEGTSVGGGFQKSQEESILLIVSVPEDEFWKPRWVQGTPAACLCPCAQGRVWEASRRQGGWTRSPPGLGSPQVLGCAGQR